MHCSSTFTDSCNTQSLYAEMASTVGPVGQHQGGPGNPWYGTFAEHNGRPQNNNFKNNDRPSGNSFKNHDGQRFERRQSNFNRFNNSQAHMGHRMYMGNNMRMGGGMRMMGGGGMHFGGGRGFGGFGRR